MFKKSSHKKAIRLAKTRAHKVMRNHLFYLVYHVAARVRYNLEQQINQIGNTQFYFLVHTLHIFCVRKSTKYQKKILQSTQEIKTHRIIEFVEPSLRERERKRERARDR